MDGRQFLCIVFSIEKHFNLIFLTGLLKPKHSEKLFNVCAGKVILHSFIFRFMHFFVLAWEYHENVFRGGLVCEIMNEFIMFCTNGSGKRQMSFGSLEMSKKTEYKQW